MAYVSPNFKTKKALREALATNARIKASGQNAIQTAGNVTVEEAIIPLRVFQPGLGSVPLDGYIALEGPHYPEPHRWYAEGTMKGGELVAVK